MSEDKELTFTKVMANLAKRFDERLETHWDKAGVLMKHHQASLTREEWEVLQNEVQKLITFQELTLNKEYREEEHFDDLSSFDIFYDDLGKIVV